MKNLSKNVIINELKMQNEILIEIYKKIEERGIRNPAHKLYEWKNEIIGAMDMLEYLLTKFEENE